MATNGFIEADRILDTLFEQRLVAFDSQDIIGSLVYYFRCDVLLSAHCIKGYDAPFDFQQGKQMGDVRELVAFLLGSHLPQAQPVRGGESRTHVYGRVD